MLFKVIKIIIMVKKHTLLSGGLVNPIGGKEQYNGPNFSRNNSYRTYCLDVEFLDKMTLIFELIYPYPIYS